jgi:hypothetical protein
MLITLKVPLLKTDSDVYKGNIPNFFEYLRYTEGHEWKIEKGMGTVCI